MRRIQPLQKYAWLPVLVTAMTVVVVGIGLLALHAVETRQIAMTGDNLALTASAIADNLDEFLDDRLGYLGVASSAPVFKKHDTAAMTEYLEVIREARHNSFVWLGATDATGRIIASTNPAVLGQDRNTSTWFRAVRDTGMAHVGDVDTFTEAGGVEAVSFTVPITGLHGTFLGTVTAQVGIPEVEEVLTHTVRSVQAQQNFSGTLQYQFFLRNGYAFVDSDLHHKGNVNLKHLGLRSAFLAESEHPGYIEEEHLRRHVPVVTGYARSRGHGNAPSLQWGILLRMDRSEVLAPTRTALQHLAILGVTVWMPMFALLLWATSRLRTEWRQARDESAHARAAEAALRESEQQTRAILGGALDAIIVLDSGGTITDWNPRAEAIFGWTRDEVLGRSLAETIIPLQYRNAHEQGLRRSLAGGGGSLANRRAEMTALRRDGTEFPVELTVNVLKNETAHRFTAFITDITERKQAEEERKVLSTRNEALVKALGQIVYDWKPLSNELAWAGDYTKVLGYSTQEMGTTTESWTSRVYPDDLQRTFAEVGFAAREHRNYDLEYRFRHRDGSYRWMHDRGVLITGSQGDVERVIGVFIDITERKQAEEALRDSQERFRKAFDEAPIGIALCATDGRWLQVNQVLCQIVGYTEQELLSTNFQSITHPDDLQADLALARQLLNGEIPTYQLEKRYIHKLGHAIWIQLTGSIVRGVNNTPLYFIAQIQDITERKKTEEALRSNERVLRAVLKEREQLVQNLHDGIIQSLYAIGMSIEECRRLMEEDPEKAKMKLGQEIADVNAVIRAVRSHLAQGEDDVPLSASRFKAELTRVAGTMERANALHFRLKMDHRAAECLTTEERRELLYIAQEAMSNCLRHSNASVANVSLRLGRDRVCLEVEDDGRGFDKQILHETNGGLRNIERRAAKIGAIMEIVSHREYGTRLRLDVPIHISPGVFP